MSALSADAAQGYYTEFPICNLVIMLCLSLQSHVDQLISSREWVMCIHTMDVAVAIPFVYFSFTVVSSRVASYSACGMPAVYPIPCQPAGISRFLEQRYGTGSAG